MLPASISTAEMWTAKEAASPTSQLCCLPTAQCTRDLKGSRSVILDPITHSETIKRRGRGEGEELVKRSWRENCPAESTALARGVGRAPSQATPSVGTPGMLNYVPCRWGSGRTDSVLEKLKQADMGSGLFPAWRLGEEVMARWRQGPGNGAVLERLSGQVMCECPRAGHVGQRAGLGSTWASP